MANNQVRLETVQMELMRGCTAAQRYLQLHVCLGLERYEGQECHERLIEAALLDRGDMQATAVQEGFNASETSAESQEPRVHMKDSTLVR